MSRVLVIESSARQRGSVSRLLTAEFISTENRASTDRFQVRRPGARAAAAPR